MVCTVVAGDKSHKAAVEWISRNRQPLLTTDYIVDETLTLLRSHDQYAAALRLGSQLFAGTVAQVRYLVRKDIEAAWRLFRGYGDKEWSFTDCTSKVIMEKLGITQAFAFDQHFRQFGSVTVVP